MKRNKSSGFKWTNEIPFMCKNKSEAQSANNILYKQEKSLGCRKLKVKTREKYFQYLWLTVPNDEW